MAAMDTKPGRSDPDGKKDPLQQVLHDHRGGLENAPLRPGKRMFHIFQSGMVSEAALQELLHDSERIPTRGQPSLPSPDIR